MCSNMAAAQECTESSSAAISSSAHPPSSWWGDLHHHSSSISSWASGNNHTNTTSPWNQPNPSSNSSCEEDVSMSTSFTNVSNHSGLSVESSRRLVHEPAAASSNELIAEHASDTQLWSHILLGVGSNGDLHSCAQDVGENLLDPLSTKGMSPAIFEPACDYLKKMDSNWEFTNSSSSSFNSFEKNLNGFNDSALVEEGQKLTKLVNNWSIAPPDPEINRHLDPLTCNISLSSSLNHYSSQPPQGYSDLCRNSGFLPSCYGHDSIKVENEHRNMETPTGPLYRRSFNSNGSGYHVGLNNSLAGDNSCKYYYGMPDTATCTSNTPRNLADVFNFSSRFTKPLIDIQVPKPSFKSLNLSDSRKQGHHSSSTVGKPQGNTGEGKKKRSEDTSDSVMKKPKNNNDTSTASSTKVQAPKVKLGDRITALQQIVSPFGKTDTASVLYEAIQYIKFLQEQVQLLSNPYMNKNNSLKDPWGGLDRKEHKGDTKIDLRSRGLCLVPISCTPQVYHENTGSDYWTPTYGRCLYR